jgi:glycosidase
MTNFVTTIGPKALAQAHNLFFTNFFTPNVGLILGSRRGDGCNSNNLVVNGTVLGQGVYTLTNGNQVTDFPGFNPTGGCLISQWGDAGDDAAYAGIQVGISKASLGLTGTNKVFRAAAIFCGGPDGTRGYFSREAYGQSVAGGMDQFGNFGVSNVVLIGSLVSLSDTAAPAYAPVAVDDNAVMMQGFFWDVPRAIGTNTHWYNVVASNAVDLAKSGFTSIWLPPPQKSRFGVDDDGYAPYDHYDLGQYFQFSTTPTRYGTLAELTNATAALSARSIAPYVDIVINHMRGDTSGNASGYYTNYASGHFYKTPADRTSPTE